MFIRTATRRNRDGSAVRYYQLVHNQWDKAAKTSRTTVVYNFGRTEDLDRPAIERLVASLTRLLGTEATAAGSRVRPDTGTPGLEFVSSVPAGGAWLLDGLWDRLGVDTVLTSLLAKTRRDRLTERVLFALVANRALAPSSKLAAAGWVGADVHIRGLAATSDDACYRAMDWLVSVEAQVAKAVYSAVADLFTLEVDLLFFDTTSTYFQVDTADDPVARDATGHVDDTATPASSVGFRAYGNSKDHRRDLPQVVIGMAVTRTGIPVRVWSWPGNTADSALIRQVKTDLHDWRLGQVVWVADRGFTSAENRRFLQAGGHGYILGEKIRSGNALAAQALSRQGRYTTLPNGLQVKEVTVADHERFVVCYNPATAAKDGATRQDMLTKLTALIDGTDAWTATKRAELRGVISTRPGLNRYLRTTSTGLLRIDHGAVKAEAKLDGKYLLRTSDPHLSVQDIAAGYTQLLQVERAWRDMKHDLDLRPVYHRLEDRIRAHVLLCWLALLLIRLIENTTDTTWPTLRTELQRLHVGTFTGPAGTYQQSTPPSPTAANAFTALDITPPPRILHLDPTTR